MKVIASSNFNDDMVSDYHVCITTNKAMAEQIAEALNFFHGEDNKYFYKAVSDDYKFYRFEV